MDVVIITPEPGRHKEIGQRLLALAENPRDVQWVTWPRAGYSIPLSLYVKFDTDKPATGGIIEPGQRYIIGENGPPPQDPPRRRGRPRRNSTDNNTSEEE